MPKNELKTLRERMEKVIEHLKGEFLAIRTGRAHPGLVSDIKVDYYGAPTKRKWWRTAFRGPSPCLKPMSTL
jgi:ribosome recycling factor